VLPTARPTSSATARPVAIEVPRSPLSAFHSQMPNWTVGLAHLVGERLRGVGRQHRDERIARRDVHQQETHQRHREHDRHDQDETLGDVDEHVAPISLPSSRPGH
jgi:hypothetical protein